MALVGVLADRDIEIGDVAVERRADVAIVDIELRVVNVGLGLLAPRVDIAVLAEFVLGLADLAARWPTAASRPQAAARIEDVVGGDEVLGQKRFDAVQILTGVCEVGLGLASAGRWRANRVVSAFI